MVSAYFCFSIFESIAKKWDEWLRERLEHWRIFWRKHWVLREHNLFRKLLLYGSTLLAERPKKFLRCPFLSYVTSAVGLRPRYLRLRKAVEQSASLRERKSPNDGKRLAGRVLVVKGGEGGILTRLSTESTFQLAPLMLSSIALAWAAVVTFILFAVIIVQSGFYNVFLAFLVNRAKIFQYSSGTNALISLPCPQSS